MLTAKAIVAWLQEKLGDDYDPEDNKFWCEHSMCGSTQNLHSEFTINYTELEKEMDAWIAETFQKDNLSKAGLVTQTWENLQDDDPVVVRVWTKDGAKERSMTLAELKALVFVGDDDEED